MRKCLQQLLTFQELREKDVKGDLHRNTGNYRAECNISHEQGQSQLLQAAERGQRGVGEGAHGGAKGVLPREAGMGWSGKLRRKQKGDSLPGRARQELLRKGTPRRAGGKRPTHHLGNLGKEGPEPREASGFSLEGTGKSERQQGGWRCRNSLKVNSSLSPCSHVAMGGNVLLIS